MKEPNPKNDSKRLSEADRMKDAMDAYRNLSPERAISAMPVIVPYTAIVGRVEHSKRGEEHYFKITRGVKDGSHGQEWEQRHLNAHAVRDEFLAVRDWSGAYDFLSSTGIFSTLNLGISWGEFQRWQTFARLVLEHEELAIAMQRRDCSGQLAEALKALTGIYPSSFFADVAVSFPAEDVEWFTRQVRLNPEFASDIQKGERRLDEERRNLWAWFRRPPGKACSIEWLPKVKEDADAILPKLRRGGAMMEFLLPREALRPAFVIRPSNTLEAIAAAIYADHCNGVEYRACEFCFALFPVGRQKSKRFCNQEKCKNAAHSRKIRARAREQLIQRDGEKIAIAPGTRGQTKKAHKGGK